MAIYLVPQIFPVLLAVLAALAAPATAADTVKDIPRPMTSYYEYGDDNPSPQKNWCGNAALKSVCGWVTEGQDVRRLDDIEKIFRQSVAYLSVRDGQASLLDLRWAAQGFRGFKGDELGKPQKGYGLEVRFQESARTEDGLFLMAKAIVDSGSPAIVPSEFGYTIGGRPIGHHWILVGYAQRGNVKALRFKDVAKKSQEKNAREVSEYRVSDFLVKTQKGSPKIQCLVISKPKAPGSKG